MFRIVLVAIQFNAPAVVFTKRMVSPVPTVGLKDIKNVFDISIRTPIRSPADGAELSDVNFRSITLLKLDYLLKFPLNACLIPNLTIPLESRIRSFSVNTAALPDA